ncbi:MAG: chemotaxis protein CheB, partial [Phycisphaerales bacterium]
MASRQHDERADQPGPDSEQGSAVSASDRCIVVAVGASAGGLGAYRKLLSSVPPDTGLAFVLIQHLDPSHESLMADLLSKHTRMPVQQVDQTTVIEPNHVYVIPPSKFLRFKDGALHLEAPELERGQRMPIDFFFSSLAEDCGERAVGVVLSGTGADGTRGIKEIKASGGMTMAQRPATAEYEGMPRSAVTTGMVDFVIPIEEMAAVLVRYSKHPYVLRAGARADLERSQFDAVLGVLRAHTEYDFRCYKR